MLRDFIRYLRWKKFEHAFRRIRQEFDEATFLDLLDLNRDERAHTRFIGWLLDSDENHGLCTKAADLLLKMIHRLSNQVQWPARLCMGRCTVLRSSVEFERQVHIPDTNYLGYIDVLLRLEIKDHVTGAIFTQVLIVENKVDSEEHTIGQHAEGPMQTSAYRAWGDAEFGNPIYIFLTPRGSLATCEQFINVSYQNLVDCVIDPLVPLIGLKYKEMVVQYIITLGYSEMRGRECPMAIGMKERETYRRFWNENRDCILRLLKVVSEDERANMPDEERQRIDRLCVNRNNVRYQILIDGVVQEGCTNLTMSSAALKTVELYVRRTPNADLNNVIEAFPRAANGHYEVLVADDGNRRPNIYPDARQVQLANNVCAYVTNQWYAELWPNFVACAEGHGIVIETDR